MRWQQKELPVMRSQRRITKFLLFPLTINNETRWLEQATYAQRYKDFGGMGDHRECKWDNIEWIDNKDGP